MSLMKKLTKLHSDQMIKDLVNEKEEIKCGNTIK